MVALKSKRTKKGNVGQRSQSFGSAAYIKGFNCRDFLRQFKNIHQRRLAIKILNGLERPRMANRLVKAVGIVEVAKELEFIKRAAEEGRSTREIIAALDERISKKRPLKRKKTKK